MEAQFELLSEMAKNGDTLNLWQNFFVKFYQAFLYADRWQQYFKGVGTTLLVSYSTYIVYAGAKDRTGVLPAAADKYQAAEGAVKMISDFYGYILDMAFRTNAANANLQLQTDAVNRVYEDQVDTNLATQGGGSYMTFKATNGMTEEMITNLMKQIRVGFVSNEGDSKLLGIATLDTVAEGADQTYTGKLTLKSFSLTDGVLEIKEAKDNATLVKLNQGVAMKISVIVWLDGDAVNNSMVANGTESLTGSLNLQFSTDATLTPMQNTKLMEMSKTTP